MEAEWGGRKLVYARYLLTVWGAAAEKNWLVSVGDGFGRSWPRLRNVKCEMRDVAWSHHLRGSAGKVAGDRAMGVWMSGGMDLNLLRAFCIGRWAAGLAAVASLWDSQQLRVGCQLATSSSERVRGLGIGDWGLAFAFGIQERMGLSSIFLARPDVRCPMSHVPCPVKG